MSRPISIPSSHNSDINTSGDFYGQSFDNDRPEAIMIYPGVYPQTSGIITHVTTNYNSYNTLCSMIGGLPASISLQYIHQDPIKLSVDSLFGADILTFDTEFNPISYYYTLYYDTDAQQNKNPIAFNQIISKFTKRQFWGRVIVVDENPGHPIIQKLYGNIDAHSI